MGSSQQIDGGDWRGVSLNLNGIDMKINSANMLISKLREIGPDNFQGWDTLSSDLQSLIESLDRTIKLFEATRLLADHHHEERTSGLGLTAIGRETAGICLSISRLT